MEIIQNFFTATIFQLNCGKEQKKINGEINIGDIQMQNNYGIAENTSQNEGMWNSLKSVHRRKTFLCIYSELNFEPKTILNKFRGHWFTLNTQKERQLVLSFVLQW